MELKNYAIDFGNGYVKAKSDLGKFIIPAKIGFEKDLGTSSLDGEFETKYRINRFSRKQDSQVYIFGEDIEDAISNPNDLISTNSNNVRYNLKSFEQLVEFSLSELAKYEDDNTVDVRLVTGMPSVDIQKKEIVNTFEDFLKGVHVVKRNNEEFIINVKEVKIIEQPLGTLLNLFLNEDLMVHKRLKEGLIVVVDFGSGTTIVDIYKNMKRVSGQTIKSGMIQFYKKIADILLSEKSLEVDPHFIEVGIRDKTYLAKVGNQSIDFKDIFDNILEQKIQRIVQSYEDEIDQEALVNDFIVTGGGSFIIGDQLKEQKKNFRLIDNPQFSTTNGYYKLAKSMRKE